MQTLRNLDDALWLLTFEFLTILELARSELTSKRWCATIRSHNNAVVNALWRRQYFEIVQVNHANSTTNALDWRGKVADIYPTLIPRCQPVAVSDIHLDKLRLSCRAGHTATLMDDDMLILYGGASHLFLFTNHCDIISFQQNKILAVSRVPVNAPVARWMHTVSMLHGRQFLFGGQSDNGFENDVHLMSPVHYSDGGVANVTFSIVPSLSQQPAPRGGHSMVLDDDCARLILFGGMTIGQHCLNDAYALRIDPSAAPSGACVWSVLSTSGSPPPPRWCHSSCLVGGHMLVFGGWRYAVGVGARHEFTNDLYMLHLASLTWIQIETLGAVPRPRCQAPCWTIASEHCRLREVCSKGYLVIYGGACHAFHEVYSITTL